MSSKRTVGVAAALSLLLFDGATVTAKAQSEPPAAYSPPPRPLIQVNPRPIYRRCAARYVVQYRPSGTVLFPEKHCWWQRG